jgi:hypothetical protein
MCKMHRPSEEVERLKVTMETNGINVDNLDQKLERIGGGKCIGCLLQPPTPIFCHLVQHRLAEMNAAERRNAANHPTAVVEEKLTYTVLISDEDDLGDLDIDGGDNSKIKSIEHNIHAIEEIVNREIISSQVIYLDTGRVSSNLTTFDDAKKKVKLIEHTD